MKKALKWILIIFVVVFVGSAFIAGFFGGSSEETSAPNEATADMTPKEIDLEIYGAVRSAAASYNKLNTMMQQLDTGETSLLELYDYCEQVKDWGLLEVESARSAYLSNSGLSEEEIQQQFDY